MQSIFFCFQLSTSLFLNCNFAFGKRLIVQNVKKSNRLEKSLQDTRQQLADRTEELERSMPADVLFFEML